MLQLHWCGLHCWHTHVHTYGDFSMADGMYCCLHAPAQFAYAGKISWFGASMRLFDAGRMELGDVSWHHGWLLHHAPAQAEGSAPRLALAVSYFVDGARVIEQQCEDDEEDREGYEAWCGTGPGKLAPGQIARHALLPLVHC